MSHFDSLDISSITIVSLHPLFVLLHFPETITLKISGLVFVVIINDFYFLSSLTSQGPLFGAESILSLVGINTCQIFAGSYLSLGLA